MKSSRAGGRRRMLAWMLGSILLAAPAARAAPAQPDSIAPGARVTLTRPDSIAYAASIGMLRPDKLQHFTLSLTLGLGSGLASRRPAVALAVPLGLGLAKETRDRRVTHFDLMDLAADLAGAAAAAVLVRHLER